ncbi:MAG: penicillin-binding transpeptidase domain-containing protein [Patescibacteria group bacterium]|nr:penicillin-binding transpeptidase domain-containing protein [Patescibacteria group bacterium]
MAKKKFIDKITLDDIVADTSVSGNLEMKELPLNPVVFKVVFGIVIALIAIAASRIFYLSVIKHDFFSSIALANVNEEVPIVAPRGIITDRFGTPLVNNKPIFSVFLNVSEMVRSGEENQVITDLQNTLGISSSSFYSILAKANLESNNGVVIARDITRDQSIAIQSLGLNSLQVENDYRRDYLNPAFSTFIGYVGYSATDNELKGRAGLEEYYNSTLQGENGATVIYHDAIGKPQGTATINPKMGQNLQTTIDGPLQEYIYQDMSAHLQAMGKVAGLELAINPQNGQILSMISFPTYDANNLGPALSDPNHPLFDRIVSGTYSPGSTIKPLMATAGLKEGVITTSTTIFSPGYLLLPNPYDPSHPTKFLDWQYQGWVNVFSAIAKSCDVFFYEVGGGFENQPGLGIQKIITWWKEFGLGQPTGIDLSGEASGNLPDPTVFQKQNNRPWLIGDTYNVSIGQGGLLVTPLQLVDAVSAIADGGVVYNPHLNLNEKPKEILNLTSLEPQFKIVQQGMIDTVAKPYGTAYTLHTLPLQTAGKSGSAQTHLNKETNALYIGYAPVQNPQIVMLILVENATEGSLNAVPIFKDVMNWYYTNRLAITTTTSG